MKEIFASGHPPNGTSPCNLSDGNLNHFTGFPPNHAGLHSSTSHHEGSTVNKLIPSRLLRNSIHSYFVELGKKSLEILSQMDFFE